jgi:peptidoglycan hydrolase-like protein with peptidoglycan-binding domain
MGYLSTTLRGSLAIGALVAGSIIANLATTNAAFADTTTSVSTLLTTTSVAPMSTASTTVPRNVPLLRVGSKGAAVRDLQRRLSTLGYWLGPIDGVFGNLTQQAVYALQKASSLARDGVVGVATSAALSHNVRPRPRSKAGTVVEIDLRRNLLMLIKGGKLATTLNTSTGGGYRYTSGGVTSIANTPRGVFAVFRQVNRMDISPLGQLWRPKYFTGGYAIHGSASVPPYPVSHGCVRLSNEAMDWIWATNRMPIGMKVWVYF